MTCIPTPEQFILIEQLAIVTGLTWFSLGLLTVLTAK